MSFQSPQWPPEWPEIADSIRRCVESGDWGRYHSPVCEQLEAEFCRFLGAQSLRLCSSGSAAIELALRAAKVSAGDEVIVSAYDYSASLRSVELLGARPVLVDVGEDGLTIDPDSLSFSASENVRAVIASHLFGVSSGIARLRQVCDDRGWTLIEDGCQTPGMKIGQRRAGTFGHFATFSFGGSKPITAGAGGVIVAGDDKMAARLGPLMDRPGDVYAMSPLQAAAVLPQLDLFDEINGSRNRTAEFIRHTVQPKLPSWKLLSIPAEGTTPTFYKLAWLAESGDHRDRIVSAASEFDLPIGVGLRDHSRVSQRRCRKPMSLDRSARNGERLFVLDQRALLCNEQQYEHLANALIRLHDQTAP